MKKKILLLISKRAYYLPHWEAFKRLCRDYNLDGAVITTAKNKISAIHSKVGLARPGKDVKICKYLWQVSPDYIWAQEEPFDPSLYWTLIYYFFNRRVKIITAVCENIFPPIFWPLQKLRSILWTRLDGIVAVAKKSLEGVQKAGMPVGIPAVCLAAGGISPPDKVVPMNLGFSKNDFVIGFVGRTVYGKGWRTLLESLDLLPVNYKLVMVTEGPEEENLDLLIKNNNRVKKFKFMEKENLWGFYKAIDCLVLPSIDTLTWVEQVGGVLIDAMAMGVPVVASNSGGMSEIIGQAGLIFPQKNSEILAQTITKIATDKKLAAALGKNGIRRFAQEFSITAYARKIAACFKL